MSAKNKARVVWIFPIALLASWMAVRGLAASPDVAATARGSEIADASLRRLIGGFADAARTRSPRLAP
jgi:hypothetical protein